jgi:hypothetical protein
VDGVELKVPYSLSDRTDVFSYDAWSNISCYVPETDTNLNLCALSPISAHYCSSGFQKNCSHVVYSDKFRVEKIHGWTTCLRLSDLKYGSYHLDSYVLCDKDYIVGNSDIRIRAYLRGISGYYGKFYSRDVMAIMSTAPLKSNPGDFRHSLNLTSSSILKHWTPSTYNISYPKTLSFEFSYLPHYFSSRIDNFTFWYDVDEGLLSFNVTESGTLLLMFSNSSSVYNKLDKVISDNYTSGVQYSFLPCSKSMCYSDKSQLYCINPKCGGIHISITDSSAGNLGIWILSFLVYFLFTL